MRCIHGGTARAVAMVAALSLIACSDGGTAPGREVGAVLLSAPQTELEIGATIQLAVTLLDQSGVVMSGGPGVDWTSSQSSVATVSAAGLVAGRAAGTTRITAKSGSKTASVDLRIRPQTCTSSVGRSIGVADARSGTLSRNDCLFYGGAPAQGWRLTLSSTTMLGVELSSSSFVPLVLVTDLQMNVVAAGGAGGPGGSSLARVARDLPAGEYVVWAVNDGQTDGGAYQLTTRVHARCTGATDRSIGVEDQRDGTIASNDCMFVHGQLAQGWRLDVASARVLQVEATAERFGAMIVLTDAQMNVLNVGLPGGINSPSRMVGPVTAGQYIVWVTSDWMDAVGPYRLTTGTFSIPTCTDPVGTIAIGQTRSGVLDASDCRLSTGHAVDAWLLVVTEQMTLDINLMSASFDTYLYLADRTGGLIAIDDDGGDGRNSRLISTLAPGEYLVVASSYQPGTGGPYQLSLSPAIGMSPSRAGLARQTPSDPAAELERWRAKWRR